jgi:hypothetical protein
MSACGRYCCKTLLLPMTQEFPPHRDRFGNFGRGGSKFSGGFRYFAPIAKILDTAILEFFNRISPFETFSPGAASVTKGGKRLFAAGCTNGRCAGHGQTGHRKIDATAVICSPISSAFMSGLLNKNGRLFRSARRYHLLPYFE